MSRRTKPRSTSSLSAASTRATSRTDWIAAKHGPGMTAEERLHLLTTITYEQWLVDYLGAPEQAMLEYQRGSHGLLGAGAQATSAADNYMLGRPGFRGAQGLPDPEAVADSGFPGIGRTPQMDNQSNSGPTRLWPDGNSSLLRLLVSKLIPATFPDGPPNQEQRLASPYLHALGDPGGVPRRAGPARVGHVG